MVDPVGPLLQVLHGIAAADQEVACVHAESDFGHFEHPGDLVRRLDVGAGLVVEDRLGATRAAPVDYDCHSSRDLCPLFFGVATGWVALTRARMGATEVGAM